MNKLTDEEKKQRKREQKSQKLKEAEKRRVQIRKDELAREVKTGDQIQKAQSRRWYKENYAAHFPIIKEDMEAVWHWSDRALDTKDFIASQLMDALDDTKLQQDMSWQDSSLKMDNLICSYHKTIENLETEYQQNLTRLLEDAMREKALGEDTAQNLKDYYKTVMFIMADKFAETSVTVQGEYVTKRDEENKKGVHNLESLSASLEKSLQSTVSQIKDTIQDYKETTESRRKELELLRARDEFYLDMIKRQEIRMAKLCEDMSNLQGQVNERHEWKMMLEDLQREREETYSAYTEVRARLTRNAALDDRQLLTLTTESNAALQDLEKIVEKGEKILRIAAMCRRLETQEEKVVPLGITTDIKSELQEGEPFGLFWRKYANANMIKRKMEKTHADLLMENKLLTEHLETVFEIMAMVQH